MTTPLGRKLADRIRASGPISIADYMAACLSDPLLGYYASREPFGTAGDFITAPEISQMFGELIGLWCVAVHETMGSPRGFSLVELGPGRGTLMADLIRATRRAPGFLSAAEITLVETSPRLRGVQQQTLAGEPITWVDDVAALPDRPTIIIANEFFDALPIRQFVRTPVGWAERMVGLDAAGALTLGLRPVDLTPGTVPEGAILEAAPVGQAIMATIAARIAAQGGAGLVIDYGHAQSAFGDTLQALRRHQHEPVLDSPGEADITAHVDFAVLARAALDAGANPAPLLTQRDFLLRLGIMERAATLIRGKDEATRATVEAARDRLIGADQMGTLFKVLAFAQKGLALPGFDSA